MAKDRWRTSLLAGVLAGAAGFFLFVVVHGFVIFPTWGTLVGFPFALLAGLALGGGYHVLRPRLPRGLRGGLAFAGVMLLPLAAVQAVTLAFGAAPFGMGPDGAVLADPLRVVLYLLVAAPASLALGLALTRRVRPAAVVAVAGLALTLSLGHNIPAISGTMVLRMWAVMASVALASGALLAALRDRWAERQA